jgi:predicted nuclease with TOPRIM domain
MSTPATRPSRRKGQAAQPAGQATDGAGIVQQVLAERRELMIANERLRLELDELRGSATRTDPRLHVLELENRALRDELAAVRDELGRFEDAVERLLEEIEKASPSGEAPRARRSS